MILKKPLVVFDLETTGTWKDKDKIIEIAMVKYHPDGTKETYQKYVNPGMILSAEVKEITGITDDDVKDQKFFPGIAQEVVDFIGDSDLGGFNLEWFDIPLLQRELEETGRELSLEGRNVFDAQKIYHIHHRRDLTAAYKQYCHKDLENAHSALADTEATYEILAAQLLAHGDSQEVEALSEFKFPKSNEFFDDERKFRWWNGEIYIPFGKHKGKSLSELVSTDKGYLNWMLSSEFSEQIKSAIRSALDGKPIKRESTG